MGGGRVLLYIFATVKGMVLMHLSLGLGIEIREFGSKKYDIIFRETDQLVKDLSLDY